MTCETLVKSNQIGRCITLYYKNEDNFYTRQHKLSSFRSLMENRVSQNYYFGNFNKRFPISSTFRNEHNIFYGQKIFSNTALNVLNIAMRSKPKKDVHDDAW